MSTRERIEIFLDDFLAGVLDEVGELEDFVHGCPDLRDETAGKVIAVAGTTLAELHNLAAILRSALTELEKP